MEHKSLPKIEWAVILSVAAAKLIFHLFTNVNYGFHRDEMLYLALGRHLDAGYWSNPPLIGWIAWFIQAFLSDSMFAVRLVPSLLGTSILIITALIAREMGGGKYAQFLAAFGMLVSPALVRSSWLFQPVIIDVFFWTFSTYFIIKYLQSKEKQNIIYFGITIGLGLLNKYNLAFLLFALVPALLVTPHRTLLWQRQTLWAVLIALLIFAPNLIWQYTHDFPVITHMQELARNQLVNVSSFDFIIDQFLINISTNILWIPALFFLFFNQKMQSFRLIGWLFIFTIVIYLILHGKSYYTIGIFPMMIAAGTIFWENLSSKIWLRTLIPVLMLSLLIPILPLGIPFLSVPKMAGYCKYLAEDIGLDFATRWEDGEQHALPQDYADMLGWSELAQHTIKAYEQVEDKNRVLIYAENYGQAGAIELFAKDKRLPSVNSFSDSYRLWIQKETNANTLIYVNDELGEDVQRIFADIQIIGKIENPYARERGTTVYLCQKPQGNFGSFWKIRVAEVLAKD
ncbi:MAG: glycosyltransferase family 39 protein [Saprospiraceae bacterium]|nr:glycosyltransferase family 39 protein [Saprospiraceae bacterium]